MNIERNNILKVGSKNLNVENWKVFHPNGRHMFTCGEKKASWYLDRNLAIPIGNKKIKFTFDPKGNGFEDNEIFGRGARINRCVVTGIEDDLQRHHIVPYCYRSYLPNEFKSKNHHDVVLINSKTHSEYELFANEFKSKIALLYNVKTTEELNNEYTLKLRDLNKENFITLNVINSIFKTYGKVSNSTVINKLHFISENSNIPFDKLSKYNYLQLYKLYLNLKNKCGVEVNQFKEDNRVLYDHGYQVVKQLDSEEKIMEFVKLWRNHFIETMQPKYMPTGWSIDFRIKTKI